MREKTYVFVSVLFTIIMFSFSCMAAGDSCRLTEFDYKDDQIVVNFNECPDVQLDKAMAVGFKLSFFSEAFGFDFKECTGKSSPTGHTSNCKGPLEEFKKLWFVNNDNYNSLTIIYVPVSHFFQRDVSDGDLLVRLRAVYPTKPAGCKFRQIDEMYYIHCERKL